MHITHRAHRLDLPAVRIFTVPCTSRVAGRRGPFGRCLSARLMPLPVEPRDRPLSQIRITLFNPCKPNCRQSTLKPIFPPFRLSQSSHRSSPPQSPKTRGRLDGARSEKNMQHSESANRSNLLGRLPPILPQGQAAHFAGSFSPIVVSYILQPSWRKNLRSTTLIPRVSYLSDRS